MTDEPKMIEHVIDLGKVPVQVLAFNDYVFNEEAIRKAAFDAAMAEANRQAQEWINAGHFD